VLDLNEALAFMPEVALDPEQARRAGHGVAVPAPAGTGAGVVRLLDDEGLIALAEPRDDGHVLKPIVGLRG
jgi:hypothetical protein